MISSSFAEEAGSDPGPSDQTSTLAVVSGRYLVFDQSQQAIYELSDLAAYVWRSLDSGMSAATIASELTATGASPDQAQGVVTATLTQLRPLRASTTVSSRSSPPGRLEPLARLTIRIAGFAAQLYLSRELVAAVEAEFGPLTSDVHETDMLLCARAVGPAVNFCSPGQLEWSCERAQFVPLLKAQLIEGVLKCAQYEVALHAAALVRDDDAVLLVGSPGAGKTTLAIALAKAGFEVLADDVILLDKQGLVTGVSFPFTAKSSSWPLLSRSWPGIVARPSHRRPDGQTLCYVPHSPVADPRPRRIGLVVLLDRQDDAPIGVEELDLVTALSALIADGATRDERLSVTGFAALTSGLREARCVRLTYSDLIEAAEAVGGLHP